MARPRGTGSVFQRNNIWWIKYYQGGRPIRESSHSPNEKVARRLLQERLGAVAVGVQIRPKVERVLMSELWEDLKLDYKNNKRKSYDDAEARWRLHLEPFLGRSRAVDIGTDHVRKYTAQRMKEEASNATINRELALLKRMLHIGAKSSPPKVLRIPNISMLQEDNIRKGFLSDTEFDALAVECATAGLWLRAMLEVGATYGWRSSEVIRLRVGQVDLDACTIRLDPGTTKNREGRVVSIVRGSKLHELMKACVVNKGADAFLFTRSNGKEILDFRRTWRKCCKAAGKPDLLFHDLRRTAARNLRRAGIAEGIIMAIGGWRTRSVFERYCIVCEGDISTSMKQLEDYRKAERAIRAKERNGHTLGTLKPTKQRLILAEKSN
jgi:integrase